MRSRKTSFQLQELKVLHVNTESLQENIRRYPDKKKSPLDVPYKR